jgi:hypothetical protein
MGNLRAYSSDGHAPRDVREANAGIRQGHTVAGMSSALYYLRNTPV